MKCVSSKVFFVTLRYFLSNLEKEIGECVDHHTHSPIVYNLMELLSFKFDQYSICSYYLTGLYEYTFHNTLTFAVNCIFHLHCFIYE